MLSKTFGFAREEIIEHCDWRKCDAPAQSGGPQQPDSVFLSP
jgi:hypothetical protein